MIYSIEGAVWGALTAAWVSARLALAPSATDYATLISAVSASVVNLVASSTLANSEEVHAAYFNIVFSLWITYAYVVTEVGSAVSDARTSLEKSFFGGMYLPLIAAAISLSFLTVQMLIAAAAIHQRLWESLAWLDIAIVFINTAQASVWKQSPLYPAVILFSTLIVILSVPRWSSDFFSDRWILWSEYASVTISCACSAYTLGVALSLGTTTWVFGVAIALCLCGILTRTVFRGNSSRSIFRQVHPSTITPVVIPVVANRPAAEAGGGEASDSSQPVVSFVYPRANSEELLFSGSHHVQRQGVKKSL